MAFESLSEKLQNVFKNLRSKGRLTEDDVKTALKEVKMALLEADVNFRVVKQFIKVCGMREPQNISHVAATGINWMGMIFWNRSSRFVGDMAATPV